MADVVEKAQQGHRLLGNAEVGPGLVAVDAEEVRIGVVIVEVVHEDGDVAADALFEVVLKRR